MMEVVYLIATKELKGFTVTFSTNISEEEQTSTISKLKAGPARSICRALNLDVYTNDDPKKKITTKLTEMFNPPMALCFDNRIRDIKGKRSISILDNRSRATAFEQETTNNVINDLTHNFKQIQVVAVQYPVLRNLEIVSDIYYKLEIGQWVIYKEKLVCIQKCCPSTCTVRILGQELFKQAKRKDLRVFGGGRIFTSKDFSEDEVYGSVLDIGSRVFLVNLKRYEIVRYTNPDNTVVLEGDPRNLPHKRCHMVPANLAPLCKNMPSYHENHQYKVCESCQSIYTCECAYCGSLLCSNCRQQCKGFNKELCDQWVCAHHGGCDIIGGMSKQCQCCYEKAKNRRAENKQRRFEKREQKDYDTFCEDWHNDEDIAAGEGRDVGEF
jgi:hypothetical protein